MNCAQEETWRDHPVHGSLVQASDQGIVRQRIGQAYQVLSMRKHKSGYLVVNLLAPIRRQSIKVHRLVSECWLGPKPEGQDTAHKDGNKLNNRPSNLMFCSRVANSLHKIAHGTQGVCPAVRSCLKRKRQPAPETYCKACGRLIGGDRVYCNRICFSTQRRTTAKLSSEKAQAIREAAASGATTHAIGRTFGVSSHTVSRIVRGLLWRT